MEESELKEYLTEYRDSNTRQELIQVLKEQLVDEMEEMDVRRSRQEHNLNRIIRDLEEDLHWIETEKLAEFNPEHE